MGLGSTGIMALLDQYRTAAVEAGWSPALQANASSHCPDL